MSTPRVSTKSCSSMFCTLFAQGDDFLISFLSNWIDINTLCILDMAMTNNFERPLWMNYIASLCMTQFNERRNNHLSLRWLILRRMNPQKILFRHENNCQVRHTTFVNINFPSLKSIDLSFCMNMTDGGLAALAQGCQEICTVSLRGCSSITDVGVLALAKKCFKIQHIDLSNCHRLTEAGIRSLVMRCPLLKSINISNSNVSANAIESLADHCPQLQTFKISNLGIQADVLVGYLASRCHELINVSFGDARFLSDELLRHLSKGCPLLRSISMSDSRSVTSHGILSLIMGCPQLDAINIEYCPLVLDTIGGSIGEHCRQLQTLRFSGYTGNLADQFLGGLLIKESILQSINLSRQNVTDTGLALIAKNCCQLECINLSGSPHITNSGLMILGQGCSQLLTIDLSSCHNLTDHGVCFFAGYCHLLKTLSLRGNQAMSDTAMMALAYDCPQLDTLDISHTSVTDFGISRLIHKLHELRTIALLDCRRISDVSITELRNLRIFVICNK